MSRNYLRCIGGHCDGRIVQPPAERFRTSGGDYVRNDYVWAHPEHPPAITSVLVPEGLMPDYVEALVRENMRHLEWEPVVL